MEQKILGFAGRKQSGKNTCANLIIGLEMMSLGLTSGFKITNAVSYTHLTLPTTPYV